MGRGVWGIDVSKYSVKAARLERIRDAVELTAVDVIQYAGAGSGDNAALDEQIRETLADLKSNNKIGGERVVVSLPGHSTFNRLIKLPPVDEAKIPEFIRHEAQSNIPFNIDEVIWDYQMVQRQYAVGEEREVILFAIKRDIVEQFLENIAPVGLNVDSIQFGPIALYNFLTGDQDVGAACVALDIGSDNTDLVILDGPKFWVRNLPITGNDITRSLQKAFNIPFGEAEKLKLKAGQSQQAQKIFNAIQPVLRDLVGEIHRSIGYYKSISKSIKFDRILLLGNATKTLNFQKFMSQSLQMPAARIQNLNHIGVAGVDAGLLNNALPSLGTALGLALQGLGGTPNTINLLPPVFRRRKELKKKQPYLVAAAACLFLLVGAMYFDASGESKKYGGLRAEMNVTAKKVKENEDRHKIASSNEDLIRKLKPLTTLPTERDLISRILVEINRNIPKNGETTVPDNKKIWILEWEFEETEVKPPSAASGAPTPGSKSASRILPEKREMTVTFEVAIVKQAKDEDAVRFVEQNLLNYDSGKKDAKDAKLPCVIKTFHLQRGAQGYEIVPRKEPIGIPLCRKRLETGSRSADENALTDADKKFTSVVVTLHIPMGEENRAKPEPAAPAKTPAPPKEK